MLFDMLEPPFDKKKVVESKQEPSILSFIRVPHLFCTDCESVSQERRAFFRVRTRKEVGCVN